MLTKKSATAATGARRLRGAAARQLGQTMDRRAFLKRSGLGVGAGALAAAPGADFYAKVGDLLAAFMDIEREAFDMLEAEAR